MAEEARFPRIKGSPRLHSSSLSADAPSSCYVASWTKLSRVSRAFTVSDVYLLCILPRLVLDEVHHVTLLVHTSCLPQVARQISEEDQVHNRQQLARS